MFATVFCHMVKYIILSVLQTATTVLSTALNIKLSPTSKICTHRRYVFVDAHSQTKMKQVL